MKQNCGEVRKVVLAIVCSAKAEEMLKAVDQNIFPKNLSRNPAKPEL